MFVVHVLTATLPGWATSTPNWPGGKANTDINKQTWPRSCECNLKIELLSHPRSHETLSRFPVPDSILRMETKVDTSHSLPIRKNYSKICWREIILDFKIWFIYFPQWSTQALSFGTTFEPRLSAARNFSMSKLLRYFWMVAASKPTSSLS